MGEQQYDLRAGLWIAAVLSGLLMLAGNAVAGAIVLSSNAPGISPRAELKDNDVLTLNAGEEVNLLLPSDGKTPRTKRVTGKFKGKVKSLYENKGVVDVVFDAVKDLWVTGGRKKDATAGTRGEAAVRSKNWRAIRVVTQTGGPVRYCFEKGGVPLLTRGEKMDSRTLRIIDSKSQSKRVEADWPPSADELPWPSAMPAKNGGTYSLTNSGVVAEVTLQEVAPGSFEGQRALETLARQKCTDQLVGWLRENG